MGTLKKELTSKSSANISRRFAFSLFSYILLKTTNVIAKCNSTPMQSTGPFFKNNNLGTTSDMTNARKALGDVIQIQGRVLDIYCKPYPETIIKIWQANSFGKYSHISDISNNKTDDNFYGYTMIKTDKLGFYKFKTIIPGSYKISNNIIRPPHIHFLLKTRKNKKLSTQLYFKGHPHNKNDFLYNSVKNNSLLETNLTKAKNGLKVGVFNIII